MIEINRESKLKTKQVVILIFKKKTKREKSKDNYRLHEKIYRITPVKSNAQKRILERT